MEFSIALLLPFIGTTLGSAMVFLIRNKINNKLQSILLGFASGVMISASIFSLILPAIDMSEHLKFPWLPAAIGFLLGIVFLLALDTFIPHIHLDSDKPEGVKTNLNKSTMLIFAVTLHNIPEGMAMGITIAGALAENALLTMTGAITLAIGLALQNLPEGAIVSTPLLNEGYSKKKAFLAGSLSGIVEPIFALLTILLANLVQGLLPYLLAFAAGAMIYVVVEELIPESHEGEHNNLSTIFLSLGFILMMILDIALA